MTALDGKNTLTVFDDHRVMHVGETFAKGTWSYDPGSKRYTITLNDEMTSYSLISRGDPPVCILFKGDVGSADLRSSWFAFPDREADEAFGGELRQRFRG